MDEGRTEPLFAVPYNHTETWRSLAYPRTDQQQLATALRERGYALVDDTMQCIKSTDNAQLGQRPGAARDDASGLRSTTP